MIHCHNSQKKHRLPEPDHPSRIPDLPQEQSPEVQRTVFVPTQFCMPESKAAPSGPLFPSQPPVFIFSFLNPSLSQTSVCFLFMNLFILPCLPCGFLFHLICSLLPLLLPPVSISVLSSSSARRSLDSDRPKGDPHSLCDLSQSQFLGEPEEYNLSQSGGSIR